MELNKIKQKEAQEKAAYRLAHYSYSKNQFVNIGFIEEDRKLLFNGHDKIAWRWGRKCIDPETYTREKSHKLCYMMFLEMSIYRTQFLKNNGLWTNEMEIIWQKILPPKYKEKNNPTDRLEELAIEEFDLDDYPKKIAS